MRCSPRARGAGTTSRYIFRRSEGKNARVNSRDIQSKVARKRSDLSANSRSRGAAKIRPTRKRTK
jgi:hypothetical protein